jgi:hypothetical protein
MKEDGNASLRISLALQQHFPLRKISASQVGDLEVLKAANMPRGMYEW